METLADVLEMLEGEADRLDRLAVQLERDVAPPGGRVELANAYRDRADQTRRLAGELRKCTPDPGGNRRATDSGSEGGPEGSEGEVYPA